MFKKCAVCRVTFKVRKDAKTAETRTLCKDCRKAVKKLTGGGNDTEFLRWFRANIKRS